MYMETRAHMNYWTTENFCGKWSLRTGALIIATVTTIWSLICLIWSIYVYILRCYLRGSNCWYMPGPEVETLEMMLPDKRTIALRTALIGVAVFHGLYLLGSIMVYVGVSRKLPGLLSGWIALTSFYMAIDLTDLFVTLPFTTLVHLLITLAHFVAALCGWVVIKSHRQQLMILKTKPPIPDNALLDYTVDGVDKIALDPIP